MPMTPPERAQIASRAPERASRPRFSIGTLVALGVFGVVTVNLYLPEAAATDLPEWTQAAAAAESSAPVTGGPETRGLLDAVEAQHPESVAALLAAGSDPGETNRFGESALHLAAPGDHAILAALIDAGADPNGRDAGGVTPLMLAATAGRADNVASLRDAGARLDMKDYQGSSPGDWARRGGHNAIARRLDSALAASAAPSRRTSSGINFAEDVFVDVKFPEWFKTSFLDLRDDLDEALNAGKQGIMLFVSAARCSYCKAFMDAVLNEPDMRGRLTASFDVIGLDIFDDSELTALDSRQYRVKDYVLKHRASNTPTLIFLGAGGEMLLRIVGYYPPDRFRQVLDYLEAKAYLRQPLGEFMRAASRAQAGDDSPIIADTLFAPPPYMLDRTVPAERPLVVVFESPGCESCERFHRRVLADTAVRRLIGEYEAVQLDATDENGRLITPDGEKSTPSSWYRRLGLDYLPSIVFFDTGGQEVMRIDSETQRFRMQGSLQLVLAGTGAEDAQLQRWRRAKAIARFQRRTGRD